MLRHVRPILALPLFIGLWLLLLAALPAMADDSLAPTASEITPQTNQASDSVTLLNRPIVTFRSTLLGMSPTQRAARAELVIQEHLENPSPYEVSTEKNAIATMIKLDGDVVFMMSENDVDKASGLSLEGTVNNAVLNLNKVIAEHRQMHDMAFMWRALLKASAAIVLFLGVLWGLKRTKLTIERRVHAFAVTNTLNLGGAEEHIRNTLLWLAKHTLTLCYGLAMLLVSYECLSFVLEQFPASRVWGEQLHLYLTHLAVKVGLAILGAIPDLFVALIIFMIARFVANTTSALFNSIAAGQTKVSWIEADVAVTTKRIINVVIWLFAFVMAYPYLPGSGTEAFKGISVLVGLMLSLGASSLVSQAGSGLILTYTRTLRKGEYVAIGEHEGTVVELGMFTTRIRNGMGVELALPNSFILNTVTKNYSRIIRGSGFVIDVTVTIGYDTPWRQVEAMLLEAAANTSEVLQIPAPRVFQTALSDFYPEYRLVCQAVPAEARQRAEVISALHANIQDAFNTYGVQIMSPHYLQDPNTPKVVPKEAWHTAPAEPPKNAS